MNCVRGDLAMVVTLGAYQGPHRAIAQALLGIPVRLANAYSFDDRPAWRLEQNVRLDINGKEVEVQGIVDAILRPIRDNDGEDEIVARVGKRAGVPA